MITSMVVAASENNAIGKDNKLLWHLPNDMAFFRNKTWGMPVIMGRKTYESMNGPLKGRANIVITHNAGFKGDPSVLIAKNMEESLVHAENTDAREAFVIGGGEVFRMFMDKADRIYLTRVHAVLEGDVYFPQIDESQWQLSAEENFGQDQRHAYSYSFQTWIRKK
jgi:dihydrofolate reductase